jgi:hypothetical protein
VLRTRALPALAASLAWLATPGAARADDKHACIAAFEDAQQLRIDGKLRVAQSRLLDCAKPECPALVRQDCAQWMSDVVAATPSVVLGARDGQGHDVLGVRASMDGVLVSDHLDGRPMPVDPGVHVFRFESPGAAAASGPAAEVQVLVRAGEKNREITVTLGPLGTSASPGAPSTAPAALGDTSSTGRAGVPALAWIFGGVAVAALGTALAFDVAQAVDYDHLHATCAGHCAQDQVDHVATERWIAGATAGVGALSLGAAAYVFFTRPYRARPTAAASWRVDFEALPHGGVGSIVGRF